MRRTFRRSNGRCIDEQGGVVGLCCAVVPKLPRLFPPSSGAPAWRQACSPLTVGKTSRAQAGWPSAAVGQGYRLSPTPVALESVQVPARTAVPSALRDTAWYPSRMTAVQAQGPHAADVLRRCLWPPAP